MICFFLTEKKSILLMLRKLKKQLGSPLYHGLVLVFAKTSILVSIPEGFIVKREEKTNFMKNFVHSNISSIAKK